MADRKPTRNVQSFVRDALELKQAGKDPSEIANEIVRCAKAEGYLDAYVVPLSAGRISINFNPNEAIDWDSAHWGIVTLTLHGQCGAEG